MASEISDAKPGRDAEGAHGRAVRERDDGRDPPPTLHAGDSDGADAADDQSGGDDGSDGDERADADRADADERPSRRRARPSRDDDLARSDEEAAADDDADDDDADDGDASSFDRDDDVPDFDRDGDPAIAAASQRGDRDDDGADARDGARVAPFDVETLDIEPDEDSADDRPAAVAGDSRSGGGAGADDESARAGDPAADDSSDDSDDSALRDGSPDDDGPLRAALGASADPFRASDDPVDSTDEPDLADDDEADPYATLRALDSASSSTDEESGVQADARAEADDGDVADEDHGEDSDAIDIEGFEVIDDDEPDEPEAASAVDPAADPAAASAPSAPPPSPGTSDPRAPSEAEIAADPDISRRTPTLPPRLPTRPGTASGTPPPTPTRSRPASTPASAVFQVAAASAAAAPGISPDFRAAFESSSLGEPPPASGPDPLAAPLDSPSELERLITDLERGTPDARAEALSHLLSESDELSKEQIGAIAYELGELCERQLGDEARAVKAFGRALQADPTLRPNLWAIRRVFYRRGLWPNLVKLIGAETRLAVSEPARADLLVEKGHILEDQVGDLEGAVEAYEQAIESDPVCLPALAGLERMALRRGDEAALERIWPLLAEASESPARKQAYYLDLVKLCGERGGDDLERAREFMARAVALGGLGERGARVREWLAERSGEPAELLAALDVRASELLSRFGPAGPAANGGRPADGLAVETDAAVRLRRQIVAVRRRQARIASHEIGDAEAAWGYLQQATALLPGEPLLIADLADLAERLGKYDELAELVEGWESEEADPARALSLSLRRADALFRGGHADAARALLATLAASQPPYLPILALRERDALSRADVNALAGVYVAAGEAAQSGVGFGPGTPSEPDPHAAAAHFLVAGDLTLHVAGDAELARSRYAKAVALAPDFAPAVLALGLLHERVGQLGEAAALYELHSDSGDPVARAHVLERLADLYQRMDGGDGPGGHAEQVAGALRRLVALQPDELSIRWRLEEALAGLDGHAEERAEVLAEIASRLDDPDQKAAALLESARLWDDELGKGERAIPIYRQVVEAWPGDRYARQALADALRRAGRWEELAAERRAEAAELGEGPAAARALREAAALLADRLDHPGEAALVYRDLCERLPDDAEGLASLAEALGRAGDHDGALDALEREVAARGDGAPSEPVLYRIAHRAEQAGRTADAEEAYRRALAVRPESVRAASALLDMAVAARDPAAEVDALIELAEAPTQASSDWAPAAAAVAAELIERAAWLSAASVGDGERALQLFERSLELEPGRRGALLGRLLLEARAGDPFALGETLSDLASALPPSYAAASLYLRAAVLAEVQGDESAVDDRMGHAIAAAPDDPGALVVASEYVPPLVPSPGGAAGSADALLRRAELFGARAQMTGDVASQHDWQLDRAELLEACGHLRDALDHVRGVLEDSPDDIRALQLLRRICRRGRDRGGLARASAALARVLGDREGKLELLREAAEIFDGELRRVDLAIPIYRRILLEDAGAEEFHRLHGVMASHDDVGGLFEILSLRIHHLDDSDKRGTELVQALVERADLRVRLRDDYGAARDLAAALAIEPAHVDALYVRAGALYRLGEASEAARSFEGFLEVAGDDRRRGQAELALAEILAENMDDLSGAIVQLEHVVRQSPSDLAVRERLIDLLMRAGENRRAAEELRMLERMRSAHADKARDQLRLARLLREKLGERSSALAALERARELDPLASEPVRQLVELYPEGDERRLRVLTQSAEDLRAAIGADPGRASLYERLAAIGQWMGDGETRATALAAQAALGSLPAEQRRFVADWSARGPGDLDLGRLSQPLGMAEWTHLLDPGAGGFAAELWSLIGPAVSMALPREPRQLGFTKAERRRPRDLEHESPAVLAFLHLFGCDQPDVPEVYVTGGKPGYARAVVGDRRALYLGVDVAAARTAAARFSLARACALLHQGTGSLADLSDAELAAWFAATARLALGELPRSLHGAARDTRRHEELVKHLDKYLDRRIRRGMAGAERGFAGLGDPGPWRRAALRTGARAGLLLCSDLPAALDVLDLGPGARALTDDRSALSLLVWAVSGERLELRRRLGLST